MSGTPASATSPPESAPASAPNENAACSEAKMRRGYARSTVTPWAFIATSRIPLAAPSASIAAISATRLAGQRGQGERDDVPRRPDRADPPRAGAGDPGAGRPDGRDQPDGRAEQRQPELAVAEPEPRLHLGQAREQRGEQDAVAGEHDRDGRRGALAIGLL